MRLNLFLIAAATHAFQRGPPRRGQLSMKRKLLADGKKKKAKKVTLTKVGGITAPTSGKMKGWDLDVGDGAAQLTAATVNGRLYVLERECSCCGWELDKGDIRGSASGEEPAVACSLCGQAYGLATGEPSGVVQRKGVSGWVGGLARNAPTTNKPRKHVSVRADLVDGDVYLDLAKVADLAMKSAGR
eukprot:CAMPEP_0119288750 /NCGR_PEP_ID=MMETSP1329-20130426/37813_1 /TAXON_ID=114041 /ORGANISM="Genus nov. species nov., Strain RCC1024" /LENGTH=186 /DNA_ID=CAMNT_0007289533 /DNA_START=165 /DNA_END=728 /DNA_ORIENTATION=-